MIAVKAFVFDGRKTATKAYDTLEEYTPTADWIDDVAVVSRSKRGFLKIHSTWAQDDDQVKGGIGWGALTGGLLGALAGPAGALAGAMGGATVGGMLGIGIQVDLEDPRLQRFADSLTNDTSALILVADEEVLNEFGDAAKRFDFGGEMLDIDLTESDLQSLRKALKGYSASNNTGFLGHSK